MKKTIVITLIVSLSVIVFSQNKDAKIKHIQEKVKIINQDTTYLALTIDNEEFLEQMTDGGGQLTGYFKGKTLYKIHKRIGLSYCVLTTEYYFEDEKLIFVYEQEDVFPYIDSLATLDYTRTKTSFKARFYFKNKRLIEKKTEGEKRILDFIVFDSQTKEDQLLRSAKNEFDLLNRKKTN